MLLRALYGLAILRGVVGAAVLKRQATGNVDDCPGYKASDVVQTDTGLTAKLTLAGPACNVYSKDVQNLLLAVNYDSGMNPDLHVITLPLTHIRKAPPRQDRG